jgi:hypothetical protein
VSPVHEQERVLDKVLKLLAKAESTTPEEAETLVAKATDLMIRAEIDQAMLAQATGKRIDEIIEKRVTFTGVYSQAQRDLFFSIGDALGFKALQLNMGGTKKRGTWIGFKHDIEQAEVLLTSLLIQQEREVQRFLKNQPPSEWMTGFDRFAYKRSHMIGFADGVRSRLRETRRASVDAVQKERNTAADVLTESTSVALVLRTKDEQVKDWYDVRYGKLKSARGGPIAGNGSAHRAGSQAGRNADVGSTRVGGARKALGR